MARRRCHGHDAGYQRGAKRIAEPYSLLVLELRPLGRRSNYGNLPTTADLANPSISTTSIATSDRESSRWLRGRPKRDRERPRPRQIEDGGDDDLCSIGQESSEKKIGAGLHPKPVQQHEGMAPTDRFEAEGGRRAVAAHGVMPHRPGEVFWYLFGWMSQRIDPLSIAVLRAPMTRRLPDDP